MNWFHSLSSSPSNKQEFGASLTTLVHAGDAEGLHGEEFDYSRAGNPTRQAFERAMAEAEGGKYGFAFSSGLAAMTTLLCTLRSGDKVVSIDDVYGGADRLMRKVAVPNWNLQYEQVKIADMEELKSALDSSAKMVWIETPTNPTLRVVDIPLVCETVKSVSKDIWIVIDSTFASPFQQQPLSMGADIVLHSATKYIGGHSDVLMGAVVTSVELVAEKLLFLQKCMGAVPSPFDCFLALRGLKTLGLRMKQQCESAMKLATFLSKHERISQVYYPGLVSHPQHEVAKRQMPRGFGGMVSFKLRGGTLETTVKLTKACKLITLAESLGGVESLIEVPSIMTHASLSAESRAKLDITDTLLRVSVGIEDADDIIQDLNQAIVAAFSNCSV